MMNTTEERILALEAHIAHLEQYVDELNKVVIQQSDAIKFLKKEMASIKNDMKGLGESPEFKKPPHY